MERTKSDLAKIQRIKVVSPEVEPVLYGAGWMIEDFKKPQILVESTYGSSHPGSKHLNDLAEMVSVGIYTSGGKPALF